MEGLEEKRGELRLTGTRERVDAEGNIKREIRVFTRFLGSAHLDGRLKTRAELLEELTRARNLWIKAVPRKI
jgi:hypothetical protein